MKTEIWVNFGAANEKLPELFNELA